MMNERASLQKRLRQLEEQLSNESNLIQHYTHAQKLLNDLREKIKGDIPFELKKEIVKTLVKVIIVKNAVPTDPEDKIKRKPPVVVEVHYGFTNAKELSLTDNRAYRPGDAEQLADSVPLRDMHDPDGVGRQDLPITEQLVQRLLIFPGGVLPFQMQNQIVPILAVKRSPPGQIHRSARPVLRVRQVPQHRTELPEILDLRHGERMSAMLDGQIEGVIVADISIENSHQVQFHSSVSSSGASTEFHASSPRPSVIVPDQAGSPAFHFPRIVQHVLQKFLIFFHPKPLLTSSGAQKSPRFRRHEK
jgi:hypothetical protein